MANAYGKWRGNAGKRSVMVLARRHPYRCFGGNPVERGGLLHLRCGKILQLPHMAFWLVLTE
jgi:hypothetical protein